MIGWEVTYDWLGGLLTIVGRVTYDWSGGLLTIGWEGYLWLVGRVTYDWLGGLLMIGWKGYLWLVGRVTYDWLGGLLMIVGRVTYDWLGGLLTIGWEGYLWLVGRVTSDWFGRVTYEWLEGLLLIGWEGYLCLVGRTCDLPVSLHVSSRSGGLYSMYHGHLRIEAWAVSILEITGGLNQKATNRKTILEERRHVIFIEGHQSNMIHVIWQESSYWSDRVSFYDDVLLALVCYWTLLFYI
jgi:hypothetical protein